MYNNQLSWERITEQVSSYGSQIVQTINQGKLLYDKWYAITYGKTDPQILALPQFSTMTQAELTDVKAALQTLSQLNDALYGAQALGAFNRHDALEPFL
jgi:hypothetical protein